MPPNVNDNLLPEAPKILEKTVSLESDIDEPEQECSCDESSYGIGDAVFSTFIVAPLVVSVWRGTWGILTIHSGLFPNAQTYLLGIIIHASFALLRSQLLSRSEGAWSGPSGSAARWLAERVLSKIYTYIFAVACIMHWRGGWGLLDLLVDTIVPDAGDPHKPVLIAALTVALYVSIALLRSARNLLAPPFFLVTDGKEPTYIFTTRFNKSAQAVIVFQRYLDG